MSEGEEGKDKDIQVLTLAITLLAGVSAVLLKLGEYFSNNIISNTIYIPIRSLVSILIFEFLLLLLFLLLRGYLIWAPEERIERLKEISIKLGGLVFLIPLSIFIYLSLAIAFTLLIFISHFELPENIYIFSIFFLAAISVFITWYLSGSDFKLSKNNFKLKSLKNKFRKDNINRELVPEVVKGVIWDFVFGFAG
ncbi:MAG: hypothetical protein SVM80_10590, partial [Halobacteriota archaeon]|nr:hypothetical protein [Halobacteriota archaeon]